MIYCKNVVDVDPLLLNILTCCIMYDVLYAIMDANQPRPVTPQPPQGGGGGSSFSAILTVFLSFIAIFAMVRIIYQTISTLNAIYKYSTATAFVLHRHLH